MARLCDCYRKLLKVDASVSADELLNKVAPQLGAVCRYVYGLIKSPMVRVQDTSMDWRVYKQTLWSRLKPVDLATAVYPRLIPFLSAATQGNSSSSGPVALSVQSVTDYGGHHAGAAVTATGEEACAYFLLDAYSEIVVYTPIPAAFPTPDGAWPPPRWVFLDRQTGQSGSQGSQGSQDKIVWQSSPPPSMPCHDCLPAPSYVSTGY